MSNYAIYDNTSKIVQNRITWDGVAEFTPPTGQSTILLDGSFAPNIGDTIDPIARTITVPVAASLGAGTILAKGRAAINVNDNFLALPSPTQAQAVAQVQALTRQVNALIRLTGNYLDSLADT